MGLTVVDPDNGAVIWTMSDAEIQMVLDHLEVPLERWAVDAKTLRAQLTMARNRARQRRLDSAISAARFRNVCSSGNRPTLNTSDSATEDHHGDLSVSDAAALLMMGERRVRQLVASSELPARRCGRRWLIARADVEALKRARELGE